MLLLRTSSRLAKAAVVALERPTPVAESLGDSPKPSSRVRDVDVDGGASLRTSFRTGTPLVEECEHPISLARYST